MNEIINLIKEFGVICYGTYTISDYESFCSFGEISVRENINFISITGSDGSDDCENIDIKYYDSLNNTYYNLNKHIEVTEEFLRGFDYGYFYKWLRRNIITHCKYKVIYANISSNLHHKVRYKNGIWGIDGGYHVSKNLVNNGKLIIKFGKVDGDFHCSGLGLVSSEGLPHTVNGCIYLGDNDIDRLDYDISSRGIVLSGNKNLKYVNVGKSNLNLYGCGLLKFKKYKYE